METILDLHPQEGHVGMTINVRLQSSKRMEAILEVLVQAIYFLASHFPIQGLLVRCGGPLPLLRRIVECCESR
jgi:hypothetical protein